MNKKIITILMIISMIFLTYSAVLAHHPYNPGRHLASQHGPITDVYCADAKASSLSLSTILTLIDEALNHPDGFEDGNEYNLQFANPTYAKEDCSDISSSNLEKISIRYYVSPEGCGGYSCIVNPRGGQTLVHDNGKGGTSTDWQYAVLKIRDASFTYSNTKKYIVNHETGHALGLLDGDRTCPGSIMHSADYSCTGYPDVPTQLDKDTIIEESDQIDYGEDGPRYP
ncbi:hypothetical protein [Chengkuizengella marina]|uniref:Uncharacterized protein n=1 Tax=Chengkuizengella marina TaxID=2507566 RepID=A0A6N9PZE5_9BACL|nr:hypothetical protein [Chengkuizengella marina]NBI28891.1 hypothetical protein [Chengkuizengella marina]